MKEKVKLNICQIIYSKRVETQSCGKKCFTFKNKQYYLYNDKIVGNTTLVCTYGCPQMLVVVRLRLRGAHVVDERVEHVGDVLERRHVQHGQLLRVLGAVRAQQRQAVRQELAPGAARLHAYSHVNIRKLCGKISQILFELVSIDYVMNYRLISISEGM